MTTNRKRWIQLRPRDPWRRITIHCTFQDGSLTFIDCCSDRRLQQRRSRYRLARLAFSAFHTRRASRSCGTGVTRYSEIPLYAYRTLRSYRSMFTRRSLWSGSPWGTRFPSDSGSSSPSCVSFWSWAAERFILSTELVLQQTKLLFDQQFHFSGCLDRFLLWIIKWSALLPCDGVFMTLKIIAMD